LLMTDLAIQFSPILYKNPGSNSGRPAGPNNPIRVPPELRTDGQQKKVPPILEYLLHQFTPGSVVILGLLSESRHRYCNKQLTPWKVHEYWPLVNEIEQAWTGEEELDRALLSKYDALTRRRLIQVGCLPSYTTTGS
jgi:hypothetical protein